MFLYDAQLVTATQVAPNSVADVLRILQTIEDTCQDGDGLKWFNWLYFQVTQTIANIVAGGTLADPNWVAELDVQFARLYFSALNSYLTGGSCTSSWAAVFGVRDDVRLARIQFALAGVNAHINHDLCSAIVFTSQVRNTVPQHGAPQYADYISLNPPLNGIIENAKRVLKVRLLGAVLPPASHLEDILAAWATTSARGQAWDHAQALWHLRNFPLATAGYLNGLDGLVTFGNRAMLVPVR